MTPSTIAQAVGRGQGHGPQLVEPLAIPRRKISVEAYDIAPGVRQLISDEFRVVKSSRRLAKKYQLPRHVVNDILHLGIWQEIQASRLSFSGGLRRIA